MKIALKPMPQPADPADGYVVGTLDGAPLALLPDRTYRAGGRTYRQEDLGEDFLEAVDKAATRILGHEWVSSLARLMRLNRRSTSKDRVSRQGLPPYVLRFLAAGVEHPFPRALGHALLCVEEILEDGWKISGITQPIGRPSKDAIRYREGVAQQTLKRALDLVGEVLEDRAAFAQRKPPGEVTDA